MINKNRRVKLDNLIELITKTKLAHRHVSLLFVCTHNSRRSQASEWWARKFINNFGLNGFSSHSAGTEATAFYPKMVETIRSIDKDIKLTKTDNETNPIYKDYSQIPPVEMYSKTWETAITGNNNIIAIMVCDSADKNCPTIPGALAIFSLPYTDPKFSDNTSMQDAVYEECLSIIGRELEYVFEQISKFSFTDWD